MKLALTQLAYSLVLISAAYGQITVTGTVRDDSGAIPVGSSVQIQQIVPLPNRNVVPTGNIDKTPPPAPFTAIAVVNAQGTYSISNVPPGKYVVCAYNVGQRFLSNCQWTSQYSTVSVASANVAVPQLVLRTGSVITLSVNDPSGAITTPTQLFGTPTPNVHYFFPGIIAENGYFGSARLASESGTVKTYVVTIPKTAVVHVFVDSDLAVTDASGNAVPTRSPSGILIQGTSDTTVSLNVR